MSHEVSQRRTVAPTAGPLQLTAALGTSVEMSGNWASKFSRSGSSPSPCVPVTRTSVLVSSSRAGKASMPDGFFSGLAGLLSAGLSAAPAVR